MDWARILAYVTGTVDQELLARNEYLAAENGILKAQLKGRLKLSDAERASLAWCRKLVARKLDGSKARASQGRGMRSSAKRSSLLARLACAE
jgi:putative transposase